MRRATVRLTTDAGAILEASLAPEAARPTPRTRVSLDRGEDGFVLSLESDDTGALRAALNSYLRWTANALRLVQEARG